MPRYSNAALKNLWLRIALRGAHHGDAYHRLNALYWLRDPWGMETPREEFRFEETNRIIQCQFGRVDHILEVGCGEGHQSERLLQVCNAICGIDVSWRAVARAKKRCARGTFGNGSIFNAPIVNERMPYDLVVACEVLYYMQDIPAVLDRMSEVGSACFVTYYEGRSEILDPCFAKISESQKARFGFANTIWKAVWWRGQEL